MYETGRGGESQRVRPVRPGEALRVTQTGTARRHRLDGLPHSSLSSSSVMTFSGALVSLSRSSTSPSSVDLPLHLQTLTDLNDYITPSQACIKPVEHTNAPTARAPGDAAVCVHCSSSLQSSCALITLQSCRPRFESTPVVPTTR